MKLDGPFKKASSTDLVNKFDKIISRSVGKWFHSRSQPYAAGKTNLPIHRLSVTSDQADWKIEFENYSPVFFESDKLIEANQMIPRPENLKFPDHSFKDSSTKH